MPKIAARVRTNRITTDSKNPTCNRHEYGAQNQQCFSTETVGHRRNDNRHHGAAGKSGGEDPTNGRGRESDSVEIESENNGQKAVGEGTDAAGGEEQPTVARQW